VQGEISLGGGGYRACKCDALALHGALERFTNAVVVVETAINRRLRRSSDDNISALSPAADPPPPTRLPICASDAFTVTVAPHRPLICFDGLLLGDSARISIPFFLRECGDTDAQRGA
jgi:hypothetical protein